MEKQTLVPGVEIDTSKEKIQKIAIEKFGVDYDLKRISLSTKPGYININCPTHGVTERSIKKFKEGYECPQCRQDQARLQKQNDFIAKANIKYNNKFNYANVHFITTHIPIEIICPTHGTFSQSPKEHLSSVHGCPKCSFVEAHNRNASSQEDFIKKAKNVHGDKYDYSLVDYYNGVQKVKIICPIHGIFEQKPVVHLRGSMCPYCGKLKQIKSQTFTTETFIQKAKEVHGNLYEYNHVEYYKCKEPVYITCKTHGDFLQRPDKHLRGKGCPYCNSSKGELKIKKWLENNNVLYESQKRFKDLKDKKPLSYDFYIPVANLLIEYNGEQHYKQNEMFGGELNFKIQQKHDKMKFDYAVINKIKLVVIPYWDFVNIEEILKKELINGKESSR